MCNSQFVSTSKELLYSLVRNQYFLLLSLALIAYLLPGPQGCARADQHISAFG